LFLEFILLKSLIIERSLNNGLYILLFLYYISKIFLNATNAYLKPAIMDCKSYNAILSSTNKKVVYRRVFVLLKSCAEWAITTFCMTHTLRNHGLESGYPICSQELRGILWTARKKNCPSHMSFSDALSAHRQLHWKGRYLWVEGYLRDHIPVVMYPRIFGEVRLF
jgi:hypothetical protein